MSSCPGAEADPEATFQKLLRKEVWGPRALTVAVNRRSGPAEATPHLRVGAWCLWRRSFPT